MKKTMAIVSDTSRGGGTLATKNNLRRGLEECLSGSGIEIEFRWFDSNDIPINNVIICTLIGNKLGVSERVKFDFEAIKGQIDDTYSFAKDIHPSPYISATFIGNWAKNKYNPNHTESYSVF